MNDRNRPWFRLPTAGAPTASSNATLAQAVRQSIAASDSARERWLYDDFLAAYAHQRDYMRSQFELTGESADIPRRILDRVRTDGFEIQGANIVASATETVQNWLFSATPPVGIRSSNASYEQRIAVDQYGLALDGLMNTDDNAEQLARIAHDGVLKGFGLGWAQFEQGEIRVKRIHRRQFSYDPADARDGKPQCTYVTELRDKYAIRQWLDAFEDIPDKAAKLQAIDRAEPIRSEHGTASAGTAAQHWSVYDWEMASAGVSDSTPRVRLTHCYRLATAPGEEDGRYVVILDDQTSSGTVLIDQAFTRTTHPVVWWTPIPNDEGIHGTGLYHVLRLWQSAIDRHMYKIQRTADKYGWDKIIVPEGSVKNLAAFAEAGIYVIEAKGNPNLTKDIETIRAVEMSQADILWVDKLITMSLSLQGINSMMSSGGSQLGAGASAVALVEELMRSTDRLSSMAKEFERFQKATGREVLHVLDDVLSTVPDYRAQFDWRGRSTSVKWADLRKQTGDSVIDVELRGELAGTRAGRLSKIMDMASRQLIDQDVAQEMILKTPDVRRAARLTLAGTHLVEWQLDNQVQDVRLEVSMPSEDMDHHKS